jgi:hypothetical protein
MGNITGWSTTPLAGCPDAHIHISRSNIDYIDSVQSYVSATYDSGTYSSPITTFNFVELPNLPPNSSAFLNPITGSIYKGNLNIAWDPSSDPNPNDTITYNIYLTQTDGQPVTLLSNSSNTSYTLDTTLYEDGEYILTGQVCDSTALCTDFSMDGVFYLDNIVIPETLTSVSLSSNNSNPLLAKDGDTITLTFEATGVISQPTVNIYSGGDSVSNIVSTTNTEGNIWKATYDVKYTDRDGQITFEISSSNLDRIYYETTDSSNIVVDTTVPIAPLPSLESGSYQGQQSISLSSSTDSTIYYSLNEDLVSCDTSTLYDSDITINEDATLKAIACDSAGNVSPIGTYTYTILYVLERIEISSSNSNPMYAKVGDTISLSFISSGEIANPQILFTVYGESLTGDILTTTDNSNNWLAEYIVSENDTNGLLTFNISAQHLYTSFTETTNLSRVTIDTQSPPSPLTNIATGTYSQTQSLTLTSDNHSVIRYTTDGSVPTCLEGDIYLQPILVSSSTTVKAVACDSASNQSALSQTSISIFPDTYVIDTTQTEEEEESIDEDINENEEEESIVEEDIQQEESDLEIEEIVPVLKIRLLDGDLNPIANTQVRIYSKPQISKTDSNGIVIFRNIPVGNHMLEYEYDTVKYAKSISIEEQDVEDGKIIDVIVEHDTEKQYDYIFIGVLSLLFILFLYTLLKVATKQREEVDN